ncbi:hypothetical protein GGP41_006503 [Bipolaris sorokiniana]|uniref:Uncharacterized protein n=1 Tax=Cochliobolus sativus TaxID=45130 RepID=A0A8H5ZQD1_COCSA|nr:hypothetical protein GGP41_006503 [Bipolaris sorokiniana]
MGRGQCQICGQVHASLRQSTVVDVGSIDTSTKYARTLPYRLHMGPTAMCDGNKVLTVPQAVSARRGAISASALNKRYDDGPPYLTFAVPTTPRQDFRPAFTHDAPATNSRTCCQRRLPLQSSCHACPTSSLATREPPPIIIIIILISIITMSLQHASQT